MRIATHTCVPGAALALVICCLGAGPCTAAEQPARQAQAARAQGPLTVAAAIDREIDRRLAEAKVPASRQADDATFLRRVSLDITGKLPAPRQVSAFLADRGPDKRRKVIDELLADPAYGRHFGTIWYHLLVQVNDDNRFAIDRSFETWLGRQFNQGRGWDRVISDILTAEGKREDSPPTVFWLAHVEGKNKKTHVKPAEALGAAAQRFLGVQYQCAECHNHPFTHFAQTDFWSLAAFFGQVKIDNGSKKSKKEGAMPAVRELPPGKGTIDIPDSKGKVVAAKFPDGTPYRREGKSLRADFARWCVSNPAFARTAVNRMWGHLFGRGLVDPIDDFREGSEPSHADVLDLLSGEFTASGCDVKHLIRCICNSKAYQRSSDALAANADDNRLCSHMTIKVMSPDVLFEALSSALGRPVVDGKAKKKGKKQPWGPQEQFLALFDTAEERNFSVDYSHGIPQMLRLLNGISTRDAPTLQRLQKAGGGPAKIVEGLYLATLSRLPTEAERKKALAHLDRARDPVRGYGDVMWALLNSAEFIFNH
jgi:hypothetical protein